MRRKHWLMSLVALAAVAGGTVWVDYLVESDEERIEALLDDVRRPLSRQSYRRGRRRWVDLETVPLELNALGLNERFGAGEATALDRRAERSLAPFWGDEFHVISHDTRVEGDTATLDSQLFGRRNGRLRIRWRFERVADEWLLAKVVVRR